MTIAQKSQVAGPIPNVIRAEIDQQADGERREKLNKYRVIPTKLVEIELVRRRS